jgi:hypothetical protein
MVSSARSPLRPVATLTRSLECGAGHREEARGGNDLLDVPSAQQEGAPVICATLFHDENGRPVLAREFDIRDADGNYPKWKPLGFWK